MVQDGIVMLSIWAWPLFKPDKEPPGEVTCTVCSTLDVFDEQRIVADLQHRTICIPPSYKERNSKWPTLQGA